MQAIAQVATMYSLEDEFMPKNQAQTDEQFIRKLSDNNITRDRTCFFAEPHCSTIEVPGDYCCSRSSSKLSEEDTNYSTESKVFGFSVARSPTDLLYEQYR